MDFFMIFMLCDWLLYLVYVYFEYCLFVKCGLICLLILLKEKLCDQYVFVYGVEDFGVFDYDLMKNVVKNGELFGEWMVVIGCVFDEGGKFVCNMFVEVWQVNVVGCYVYKVDQYDVLFDLNFFGVGCCLIDDEGCYCFLMIKFGVYLWGNYLNVWCLNYIYFLLFGDYFGLCFVMQMYFFGDLLFVYDLIFQGMLEVVCDWLILCFLMDIIEEGYVFGYEFDIVLCGCDVILMEC